MPEQAEEGSEEAKAADLDALLELFREPEEPPRKKIPGSVWLFLALVLGMVAIWLAARVATGQLVAKSDAVAMRPTKAGVREPREAEEFTGNVVEDYLARCKKGMTAREVRWIVEDFQKAGLGEDRLHMLWNRVRDLREGDDPGKSPGWMDPETTVIAAREALEMRRQQSCWYLDSLADGLSLDKEQKLKAELQSQRLIADAESEFLKLRGEVEAARKKAGYYPTGEFAPYARLLEVDSWLTQDRYAPWEFCELTEAQDAVTRHDEVKREIEVALHQSEGGVFTAPWLERASPVRSEPAEKGSFDEAEAPDGFAEMGAVFPLEAFQVAQDTESLTLKAVRKLHPAQLKILLLLRPEVASELSQALEEASE